VTPARAGPPANRGLANANAVPDSENRERVCTQSRFTPLHIALLAEKAYSLTGIGAGFLVTGVVRRAPRPSGGWGDSHHPPGAIRTIPRAIRSNPTPPSRGQDRARRGAEAWREGYRVAVVMGMPSYRPCRANSPAGIKTGAASAARAAGRASRCERDSLPGWPFELLHGRL
jgi:hypothetical protein